MSSSIDFFHTFHASNDFSTCPHASIVHWQKLMDSSAIVEVLIQFYLVSINTFSGEIFCNTSNSTSLDEFEKKIIKLDRYKKKYLFDRQYLFLLQDHLYSNSRWWMDVTGPSDHPHIPLYWTDWNFSRLGLRTSGQYHRWWSSVLDTTLCDKVCQWLAASQWFSQSTPVSSTNKTKYHNSRDADLSLFWPPFCFPVAAFTWKCNILMSNFYR